MSGVTSPLPYVSSLLSPLIPPCLCLDVAAPVACFTVSLCVTAPVCGGADEKRMMTGESIVRTHSHVVQESA